MEDNLTLQQAMELEIRSALSQGSGINSSLALRGTGAIPKLRPKSFLVAFAHLCCRHPDSFLSATARTCVISGEPASPTITLQAIDAKYYKKLLSSPSSSSSPSLPAATSTSEFTPKNKGKLHVSQGLSTIVATLIRR